MSPFGIRYIYQHNFSGHLEMFYSWADPGNRVLAGLTAAAANPPGRDYCSERNKCGGKTEQELLEGVPVHPLPESDMMLYA